MRLEKSQVLDALRREGDHDAAERAERDLPSTVDTDEHADLLERVGIDGKELARRTTAGSGGGIGDDMGGMLGRP